MSVSQYRQKLHNMQLMYTKTYEKHCELQEVGLEYCIYNIYYKVEVHPRRDHEGTEEE